MKAGISADFRKMVNMEVKSPNQIKERLDAMYVNSSPSMAAAKN